MTAGALMISASIFYLAAVTTHDVDAASIAVVGFATLVVASAILWGLQ